jgi:hypothetical protein
VSLSFSTPWNRTWTLASPDSIVSAAVSLSRSRSTSMATVQSIRRPATVSHASSISSSLALSTTSRTGSTTSTATASSPVKVAVSRSGSMRSSYRRGRTVLGRRYSSSVVVAGGEASLAPLMLGKAGTNGAG